MSLKSNVVVVNEYTIKQGKGGSRGASPGNYVLRYMSRKGAVENLAPIRKQELDNYMIRYMAREEAVETLESVPAIKRGMKKAQGLGGVAFCGESVSMSDEAIRAKSKFIQEQFDMGKTVLKTVISFDTEYLREHGVIAPDFELINEGDLRGNVDQMKMRIAICNGMRRLRSSFDKLDWVGTLQVDTKHLHAHLCMVDTGKGTVMSDGTQKGKLSARQIHTIRRGIDLSLDAMHPVKQMVSNFSADKHNVKSFIKRFTYDTMNKNSLPQFLLAVLPENKMLWRAGTNAKEMKKPNLIVREYVEVLLEQPESGYTKALNDVYEYARHRAKKEKLSTKEERKLIETGRNKIIEDCMNGVYQILKEIPDQEREVNTKFLDIMSVDIDVLQERIDLDPMAEFGLRLRSYGARLDYHKREFTRYESLRKYYQDEKRAGRVDASSAPLFDFYEFEENYHARLMCKYQHFLDFLPDDESYKDDFNDLIRYKSKVKNMERMMKDRTLRRLSPSKAKEYGQDVYGLNGGEFVANSLHILEGRKATMEHVYAQKEQAFKHKLQLLGLTLKDDEGKLKVSSEKLYTFDQVKALDLHHLLYDFAYDIDVSKINADKFYMTTKMRSLLFEGAKDYLVRSGQEHVVKDLNEKDIIQMREVAGLLEENEQLLTSRVGVGGLIPKKKTIRIDRDLQKDIKLMVKSIIETEKMFES